MGYANMDQNGAGMISRQYCRAFIIADPSNSTQRMVFLVAEIGMMSQRVRLEVSGDTSRYGDLYSPDNVILSGTHTHSGPGGFFQYTIYMITSKGFILPTRDAIVNGILESIEMAHQNMIKGRILINKGLVHNSQINRSPLSYLNNPESERRRSESFFLFFSSLSRYASNTDKEMVLLKMVADSGQDIGMLRKIGFKQKVSDITDMTAFLFQGPYVAAFASSNLGDVSPNIRGPHCINTGESCENLNNYCAIGGPQMCMAKGPGKDMFESTQIIGRNIYLKAKVQLLTSPDGKHSIDVDLLTGMIEGDPFWDAVRNAILVKPSKEMEECHKPKPILVPTGQV
ncbi:hypothetical protein JD844_006520 [Phrynosoma platyrhinos]|uniref:Neutral ceramidase n=1 Tax=Phrynosoma platyrhinos TaxID=52577 RepID=A0ABQ7T282_PHRPL|nr:hypothetical protein JD844_006520 [Phrynosoma platyrhinos]